MCYYFLVLTRRILLLYFMFLFCSGCLFSVPKKDPIIAVSKGSPTGKIINKEAFVKGGTLAILPFKAGEDAVANPQLDRIALMIVKGAVDYLNQEKTPFTVLTTQDQGAPELVIDGYIHDFDRPGKISRWVLRHKQSKLSVSGQMVLAGTKDRVMVFQSSKIMVDPKNDGLDLAYQTGQDLGRFIVDALGSQ